MKIKNKEKLNERVKLILIVILFLGLIIVGASIIKEILYFLIGNLVNSFIFSLIHFILILLLIEILFRTKSGKYLDKKIFKKESK